MSSDSTDNDLGLQAFRQPPEDAGLSLDRLTEAFAEMLGSGSDPYDTDSDAIGPFGSGPHTAEGQDADEQGAGRDADAADKAADEHSEISPRSILEAMLFVGSPTNEPLTSQQVASTMRGVRPAEIDDLVRDLNRQYDEDACPYRIVSNGAGYRLALREEFGRVRDKFYGKVRQVRLSQAAVEVMALVAYNGPLTADDVATLRGKPAGAILSLLVRRQLLRIERDPDAPRAPKYSTTPRFLELFGLESLADLPRSQELDRK
jgi:segregation and condensation protein B